MFVCFVHLLLLLDVVLVVRFLNLLTMSTVTGIRPLEVLILATVFAFWAGGAGRVRVRDQGV